MASHRQNLLLLLLLLLLLRWTLLEAGCQQLLCLLPPRLLPLWMLSGAWHQHQHQHQRLLRPRPRWMPSEAWEALLSRHLLRLTRSEAWKQLRCPPLRLPPPPLP